MLSNEHKQRPKHKVSKCHWQNLSRPSFWVARTQCLQYLVAGVQDGSAQHSRGSKHGQSMSECGMNFRWPQDAYTFNKPKKWQPQHRTRVICNAQSPLPAKQHWAWPNARVRLPSPTLNLSKSRLQASFLSALSYFPIKLSRPLMASDGL